jgi:hypothetical protein
VAWQADSEAYLLEPCLKSQFSGYESNAQILRKPKRGANSLLYVTLQGASLPVFRASTRSVNLMLRRFRREKKTPCTNLHSCRLELVGGGVFDVDETASLI